MEVRQPVCKAHVLSVVSLEIISIACRLLDSFSAALLLGCFFWGVVYIYIYI